jgi:hypothetical protein
MSAEPRPRGRTNSNLVQFRGRIDRLVAGELAATAAMENYRARFNRTSLVECQNLYRQRDQVEARLRLV